MCDVSVICTVLSVTGREVMCVVSVICTVLSVTGREGMCDVSVICTVLSVYVFLMFLSYVPFFLSLVQVMFV